MRLHESKKAELSLLENKFNDMQAHTSMIKNEVEPLRIEN